MSRYIDADRLIRRTNGVNKMTMHDLLEYGEKCLREDNEYWEQMDKFRADIDKLINRHNTIMAATIVRLALALLTEQRCKCIDCTGGYCEEECLTDEK